MGSPCWTRSLCPEATRRSPSASAAPTGTPPASRLARASRAATSSSALAAGLLPAATALAAGSTCGGSGAVTTQTGTLADGATYKIECPGGPWNGTLFLYSHGYVVPGSANPAQDAGDPVTAAWLLGHGY